GIGDAIKSCSSAVRVLDALCNTITTVRDVHRVGVDRDVVGRLVQHELHHEQTAPEGLRDVVELKKEATMGSRSTSFEADATNHLLRIPVRPRKRNQVVRVPGVGDLITPEKAQTQRVTDGRAEGDKSVHVKIEAVVRDAAEIEVKSKGH